MHAKFGNFQAMLENDLKKNKKQSSKEINKVNPKPSSSLLIVSSPTNNKIASPITFIMRITDIKFLGGNKFIRLLAFKRKVTYPTGGTGSNNVLNTMSNMPGSGDRTHSENDGDKLRPTNNNNGDSNSS